MNYSIYETAEDFKNSEFYKSFSASKVIKEVVEATKDTIETTEEVVEESKEVVEATKDTIETTEEVVEDTKDTKETIEEDTEDTKETIEEDTTEVVETTKDTKETTEEDTEEKTKNLKVTYADLKAKPTCIFKNIIVFTNDRSSENKTLENIKEAIDNLPKSERPKLYVFVAANCKSEDDGKILYIYDDKTELKIENQSNIDTLVFSRLGVQDETCCEEAVKTLQDRGFLVLNPVRYSEVACNKLATAHLLEKAELPQPRFCGMNKETFYNKELFEESMKRIFPDFKEDDEELKVVVKILDGHGGTGVFTIDCKRLTAILQTIFAIDPERELIIQKKEEGDGGDIRVHVLTLRDRQVILGAMKREQLSGDFRSNVSLGAEAKPIKLTKEQEQIALKAASVSKLPWAAVDIMPLVKDSNKEVGDNVILELNASPGTQGISEVLKTNFINILFNELNDPNEFVLQDKVAGTEETVNIDFGDFSKDFLAKLDTGNSTSASTLEVGEFDYNDKTIKFKIDNKELEFDKINEITARVGQETHKRLTIKIPEITLGNRKLKNLIIAIVRSRANKSTNMLLNCDTLSKLGYIVNPSMKHMLTEEIQKVKILN